MTMKIRMYGDPVLRKQAVPIKEVGEDLRQLAKEMLETMYEAKGIGLAAQQVGRTDPLCVIDIPPQADSDENGIPHNPDAPMPLILVNPRILETNDQASPYEEGCLSFPDVVGDVQRPETLRIEYETLDGETQTLSACGLLARAIQHEMDHLQGILFIDHMSKVKRMSIAGRLKRLKKSTRQQLGLS